MSNQLPWSVKGVDAEARALAKASANRAGMTMGEWIEQAIMAAANRNPAPSPAPAAKVAPEKIPSPLINLGSADPAAKAQPKAPPLKGVIKNDPPKMADSASMKTWREMDDKIRQLTATVAGLEQRLREAHSVSSAPAPAAAPETAESLTTRHFMRWVLMIALAAFMGWSAFLLGQQLGGDMGQGIPSRFLASR
ncbi:MAG: hypothetical protein AB7G80_07250 [Dongiaceae bacterium]